MSAHNKTAALIVPTRINKTARALAVNTLYQYLGPLQISNSSCDNKQTQLKLKLANQCAAITKFREDEWNGDQHVTIHVYANGRGPLMGPIESITDLRLVCNSATGAPVINSRTYTYAY